MKIYFVRHGETDWNAEKKLQGQTDIPINAFGRELAEKTKCGLGTVKFDKAYSSPLIRAYETAQILLENSDTPIEACDLIKEISFGIYEGMCCKGEGFNIPDKNFMNFFIKPAEFTPPEDGESIEDFWERLKQFLEGIFKDESLRDKTILVSSHGGAIRGLLSIIKGLDIANFWEGGVQQNCAISIVEYDGENAKILEEGTLYYDDIVEDYYKF